MQHTTTTLQLDPGQVFQWVLWIVSVVTFIFLYNQQVKKSVNSDDLKEMKNEVTKEQDKLKEYVDKQDTDLQHQLEGLEKGWKEDLKEIRQQTEKMYRLIVLLNKKK